MRVRFRPVARRRGHVHDHSADARAGVTAAHAAPPGISITDASITEGNSGTSSMAFSLIYGGLRRRVSVDYATANVTATAGSDYVASSGTIALSATGCKCGTLNIQIIGDTVAENTETFQVNLSNAVNKTLDDNQAIGTITDNDVSQRLDQRPLRIRERRRR